MMALLVSCASAQRTIWTWRPTAKADARSIHATAIAPNGAGAFLIGETDIKGEAVFENDYGPYGQSWYIIQWVDSRGRTLLSKRLRTKDDFYTVQRIRGASKWEIAFMGASSLGVYDGNKLRIYTLKGGKVIESQRLLQASSTIISFPKSVFSGWIEMDSMKAGSYRVFDSNDGSDYEAPIYDIKSVSLWKP